MLSLTEFIKKVNNIEKIEDLERRFFEGIQTYPGLLDISNISYDCPEYEDYQKLLYKDIIEETLDKTYDFSKFKEYLNNKFYNNIQLNIDYNKHPRFRGYDNNNRLIFQTNNNVDDKDIQVVCDLFGYKISNIMKSKGSKAYTIEPIYFNEISAKINKMQYLYHIVPLDNQRTFDKIKQSFKKKFGLKPSKREKISKHFRRLYCFVEDVNKNDLLNFAYKNNSLNDFYLIRIRLKEYLEDYTDRKIEWFEDPNMKKGVWTREMIPYKYLEFFEIKNENFPKELEF